MYRSPVNNMRSPVILSTRSLSERTKFKFNKFGVEYEASTSIVTFCTLISLRVKRNVSSISSSKLFHSVYLYSENDVNLSKERHIVIFKTSSKFEMTVRVRSISCTQRLTISFWYMTIFFVKEVSKLILVLLFGLFSINQFVPRLCTWLKWMDYNQYLHIFIHIDVVLNTSKWFLFL